MFHKIYPFEIFLLVCATGWYTHYGILYGDWFGDEIVEIKKDWSKPICKGHQNKPLSAN